MTEHHRQGRKLNVFIPPENLKEIYEWEQQMKRWHADAIAYNKETEQRASRLDVLEKELTEREIEITSRENAVAQEAEKCVNMLKVIKKKEYLINLQEDHIHKGTEKISNFIKAYAAENVLSNILSQKTKQNGSQTNKDRELELSKLMAWFDDANPIVSLDISKFKADLNEPEADQILSETLASEKHKQISEEEFEKLMRWFSIKESNNMFDGESKISSDNSSSCSFKNELYSPEQVDIIKASPFSFARSILDELDRMYLELVKLEPGSLSSEVAPVAAKKTSKEASRMFIDLSSNSINTETLDDEQLYSFKEVEYEGVKPSTKLFDCHLDTHVYSSNKGIPILNTSCLPATTGLPSKISDLLTHLEICCKEFILDAFAKEIPESIRLEEKNLSKNDISYPFDSPAVDSDSIYTKVTEMVAEFLQLCKDAVKKSDTGFDTEKCQNEVKRNSIREYTFKDNQSIYSKKVSNSEYWNNLLEEIDESHDSQSTKGEKSSLSRKMVEILSCIQTLTDDLNKREAKIRLKNTQLERCLKQIEVLTNYFTGLCSTGQATISFSRDDIYSKLMAPFQWLQDTILKQRELKEEMFVFPEPKAFYRPAEHYNRIRLLENTLEEITFELGNILKVGVPIIGSRTGELLSKYDKTFRRELLVSSLKRCRNIIMEAAKTGKNK